MFAIAQRRLLQSIENIPKLGGRDWTGLDERQATPISARATLVEVLDENLRSK